MRQIALGAAILILGLWVRPAAADDKKPDEPGKKPAKADKKAADADKKPPRATKLPGRITRPPKMPTVKEGATSEKMLQAGQVLGTIVSVNESKKSLRLRVKIGIVKVNENAVNQVLQGQMNLQRAMYRNLNNPQQRMQDILNAHRQIAQNSAQVYQMEYHDQEIELDTIEEVKVRKANPPPKYDDKGHIVRYTSKELKELRGDSKLPGYDAAFGDLQQQQTVQVSLIKKKGRPPRVRGKDKDAAEELFQQYMPKVSLILIVAEPK